MKVFHADHGLTDAHWSWLEPLLMSEQGFFIRTLPIPTGLSALTCALHGPSEGDGPIPVDEVFHQTRPERVWLSRLIKRAPKGGARFVVIIGTNGADGLVIFTAYGSMRGFVCPRETGDTSLSPEEREESALFWRGHALSA
jgi:hypothetical protein